MLSESLGAGGKPSTWLPPGRLGEHKKKQIFEKKNKTKSEKEKKTSVKKK